MTSAQLFLSGRERAKTNVVTVINEMRVALREFGRRLVERGVIDEVAQVFMLTDAELDQIRVTSRFVRSASSADRWAIFQSLFDFEPVFVVNGRVPALSDMTRRGGKNVTAATVGTVLHWLRRLRRRGDGPGTGHPRRRRSCRARAGRHPGCAADRPVVGAAVRARLPRVVVNVGAMGSHAMIVSRELGHPCVASVADATDIIPDGATVTVDGNAGTVTIDALAD